MFKFWFGVTISLIIGAVLMYALGKITQKWKKNSAIGALIGFFLGIGLMFTLIFGASRAYVITGDGEYDHYLVMFGPEYVMPNGEVGNLEMPYDYCFVINETEKDVVVEEVKYGGYGFSGSTKWVKAKNYEIIDNHKIFYFYDDKPPPEISTRGSSSDVVVRKWLRKKRK